MFMKIHVECIYNLSKYRHMCCKYTNVDLLLGRVINMCFPMHILVSRLHIYNPILATGNSLVSLQ